MRFRRKSVDIVVTGDGTRARPAFDATDAPIVVPTDATAQADGETRAPDATAVPAPDTPTPDAVAPPTAPLNGNGAHSNGAHSNGNGSTGNGAKSGEDVTVGVPFGAAVVSFEPPASTVPVAPTPARHQSVAPNQSVAPDLGGGVATMSPPLTPAPVDTSAPAPAPAPATPAPIAYANPPVGAPAPIVLVPGAAPAPAAPPTIDCTPIEWAAPGWREYHERLAATAVDTPAALASAPPDAPPAPQVPLAGPIAIPAAESAVEPAVEMDDPEAATQSTAGPAPAGPEPVASNPRYLGEMLVARHLVSREQLDHALAEQSASGLRLGAQLVALGAVTERELVGVLAEQFGVRTTDLRVNDPSPDAVGRVPEDLARRLEVLPIRVTPEGLEVAGADLPNDEGMAELEAAAKGPICFVFATPTEIQRSTNQVYQALAGMEQQVQAFVDLASERTRGDDNGTKILVDERAPVVQVVTLLLTQAVRDRASDIHIEPQDGDVRVRYRVDGVLRDVTTVPQSMAAALISRIKVMADMNIVERRRSQDGQIQTTVDGRPLDVRVATTATIWGEKAVLRLLDKTRSLRALGELGMTVETSRKFSELATSPFGMVVCAGPTGSGKTTTLYAALTEINSPDRNITTIEDPVEYVIPRINQIQVNNQAGITFADGLKSIMRQDPDVILVGEIRDVETARIAVQSALTGHFVLSSIHATDGATALQRFRDMGIEPFLITSALLAVEAQRLVRRICSHCREPYSPSPTEQKFFEKAAGRTKDEWWHGAGCNLCMHSGYSERVGVYELLVVSEAIQELVLKDGGHDEIQALAREEGMRSLKDEALRLIEDDITTVAEAIRSVYVR